MVVLVRVCGLRGWLQPDRELRRRLSPWPYEPTKQTSMARLGRRRPCVVSRIASMFVVGTAHGAARLPSRVSKCVPHPPPRERCRQTGGQVPQRPQLPLTPSLSLSGNLLQYRRAILGQTPHRRGPDCARSATVASGPMSPTNRKRSFTGTSRKATSRTPWPFVSSPTSEASYSDSSHARISN